MNMTTSLLFFALAVTVCFAPAVNGAPHASRGCSLSFDENALPGEALRPGSSSRHSFVHEGIEREWIVYLPTSYNLSSPSPLLMSFHGWGSSGRQDMFFSGFSAAGDEHNSIVVYPNAVNDRLRAPRKGWGSWNVVGSTQSPGPLGPTCTDAMAAEFCYDSCTKCRGHAPGYRPRNDPLGPECNWSSCYNDITSSGIGTNTTGSFIERLMNLIEDKLCVDVTREYASGFSNGGMMAYQMANSMSSRIAAIAPIGGSFHLGFLQVPEQGVALLDMHGRWDNLIPATGIVSSWNWKWTETTTITDEWSIANNCFSPETAYKAPGSSSFAEYQTRLNGRHGVRCHAAEGCRSGDVVRCTWNGGHTYLGTPPTMSAMTHGKFMFDFLSQWKKPSHLGGGETTADLSVPRGAVRIE